MRGILSPLVILTQVRELSFLPRHIILVREQQFAFVAGLWEISAIGAQNHLSMKNAYGVVDQIKGGQMSVDPEVAVTRDVGADLRTIWGKILQKENLLGTDNFFELGGDSLQAMNMLFLLSRRTGVELTPDVLFENPTLEELASYVDRVMTADGDRVVTGA